MNRTNLLWQNRLSVWRRRGLPFPVARMRLAPLLDPPEIFRAAEVIAIGGLTQPAALTGVLAGGSARRSRTIKLVVPVSIIGNEEFVAATALAATGLGTHARSERGRRTRPLGNHSLTATEEKAKKEEEF